MNAYQEQVKKDITLLLGYSADVIASYSLVKTYDPKQIAQAIDRLFGEYGALATDDETMKHILRMTEVVS